MALTVVTPPAVGPDGLTRLVLAGRVYALAATTALAAQGWAGGATCSYDGTNTTIWTGASVAQVDAALAAYAYNPQEGWDASDIWLASVAALATEVIAGTTTLTSTQVQEGLAHLVLVLASRLAPPVAQ